MLIKELGSTGELIPEVGMGAWSYHGGVQCLRSGLAAGALFIDTAESYGTEEVVGEAIHGWPDRVFVATKVSPQNFRRADLKRSIDASLKKLRLEQVDLLQLHEPNPLVPIEETMQGLSEAVRAGKVRFAGVSNFSVQQLDAARRAAGSLPIVSNQVRYSIIDRTIEDGLLQYCQQARITVIAYCPLARGLDRIRDCDPTGVIDELARELQKSPAQIVLNWCLCKDGVVVIPKGNTEAHILDNCGASGWRLTGEQVARLDSRIRHRRRGRFDGMVRRYTPAPLRRVALRAAAIMPAGLRRRFL